jgi:hypothetical protein
MPNLKSFVIAGIVLAVFATLATAASAAPPRNAAVAAGNVACNDFFDTQVTLSTSSAGLAFAATGGLVGIPGSSFNVVASTVGTCDQILTGLAESMTGTCQAGSISFDGEQRLGFVCVGDSNAVISDLGALATAVLNLPPRPAQP